MSQNEHWNAWYAFCKKLGQSQSRCFGKPEKDAPRANVAIRVDKNYLADESATSSVTMLDDYHHVSSREDAEKSTKRTAGVKAVSRPVGHSTGC